VTAPQGQRSAEEQLQIGNDSGGKQTASKAKKKSIEKTAKTIGPA